MRTRTSGLTMLLWGLVLAPAAFGQDHVPPVATPPRLEGAVLELPPSVESETLSPPDWRLPEPPAIEMPTIPLPLIVRGQDYAPPDPVFPLPTYSTRPENGGPYVGLQFVIYQETKPLADQPIATRGFFDADGSIAAALRRPAVPGTYIGSRKLALSANDLGQMQYTLGYQMFAGWKLRNGATIEIDWLHLGKVKYAGGASIEPNQFQGGPNLADTFLTAPVFNFPSTFAGPGQKVAIGNPGALFGIWNGASEMFIQFTQRFDQYDIQGRIPVFQTDNNRVYGIIGLRNAFLVEKYTWITTSQDILGNAGPDDTANYNNNVTNNMFGPVVGCGDEWRCCDTPVGTFAIAVDLRGAILVDLVKEYTKYVRGDLVVGSKETRRTTALTPELQATPTLCWYPIEGVQFKVGYDMFAFFNTMACPNPVSFNYQGLDPALQHQIRFFNGITAGVAFIF